MSEWKITPGKWKASRVPFTDSRDGKTLLSGLDSNRWSISATHEDGQDRRHITHIAVIERCGLMSDEQLEANARAISALPDIIGAIEGLGVLPEGYCFCFGHYRDALKPERDHTGECRAIRSALLKAKGGDQ